MLCGSAPTTIARVITTHQSSTTHHSLTALITGTLFCQTHLQSSQAHTNPPDIANLMIQIPQNTSPVQLQNLSESSYGSSPGHPLAIYLSRTDEPQPHTSRSASSINLSIASSMSSSMLSILEETGPNVIEEKTI